MKTVTINIYQFSELSETAKQFAINQHLDFLDNEGELFEDDNGQMAIDYTPHTEQEAIESIEANEYYFYSDGELASCVTYTGTHPKSGITELTFKNQTFTL
jgi:hypothetical protein